MKTFIFNGTPENSFMKWLSAGIKGAFSNEGYTFAEAPEDNLNLVFNFTDKEDPRSYRRNSQGTFVVSVIEANEHPENIHKEAYPYIIRSLSNHLMYVVHTEDETVVHFVTLEQGHYQINYQEVENDEEFFKQIYERLEPLASSTLIINNDFNEDLPQELWDGDEVTQSLSESGKKLDSLNLLPAPFPLEDVLSGRDLRMLKKLFGIGGISYGNLSSRADGNNFWMSASGIDKSDMKDVGRDFLYITDYDEENRAMKVSVPPHVTPRRASVDAIEHWKIYTAHPDVGAIVHIHAWMDGIEATEFNYPCGTIELADAVSDIINRADDPSRAVVGLKNHGLTITGHSLEDIFERIEGKIIPQVPMS